MQGFVVYRGEILFLEINVDSPLTIKRCAITAVEKVGVEESTSRALVVVPTDFKKPRRKRSAYDEDVLFLADYLKDNPQGKEEKFVDYYLRSTALAKRVGLQRLYSVIDLAVKENLLKKIKTPGTSSFQIRLA